MKSKSWRNIGIILAALILIYLYTKMQETRYTTPSDEVFDIQAEDVGRLHILDAEGQIELIRLDTSWVAASYEERDIQTWRLDSFFSTVLGVERESMVSNSPDKWVTYGVDDSSGLHLRIYDLYGTLQGNVVIGQSTTNYQSSYLREAGSDEVYLTNRNIYYTISTDTSFWLEPLPEPEEEAPADTTVDI